MQLTDAKKKRTESKVKKMPRCLNVGRWDR